MIIPARFKNKYECRLFLLNCFLNPLFSNDKLFFFKIISGIEPILVFINGFDNIM